MEKKPFKRFTAFPNDPYRPFKRKKRREPEELWCAPEHLQTAKHMERRFPEDDEGRPMKHLGKRLVLDPRPNIMQPKREPIFLGIDA